MTKKTKVIFRQIGSFSGPVIHGTFPAFAKEMTLGNSHLVRAFWLTTMVESGGMLGTIMMADGTGVTAGLEQVVAVYPRDMKVQGPLFKMLNRINATTYIDDYLGLSQCGWRISEDGVLRDKFGAPVPPKKIRDTFTPMGGKVNQRSKADWEQASEWALRFHNLFGSQSTSRVQYQCGIEQQTKFAKRFKSQKLNYESVEEVCYDGEVQNPNPFNDHHMDLAMCMWWNYKTNAPSPALTALNEARLTFDPKTDSHQFAKCLLNRLRTSRYGRWGTNRYDRSRECALSVWPSELFEGPDAVMPARKK